MLCFPFGITAQYRLSGVLTDTDKHPVSGAVITLKNKENTQIITFSTSDMNGQYELIITNPDSYQLEVSHIAYESQRKSLQIDPQKYTYISNFQLIEKKNELDEVVVLGESLAMKQKGDTLAYNLKAFTTGGEKNLKDVLKRLPGIDIDPASGKIKANGKVIDNLLIDGNKFFGENHKLATENLPAEMVAGIDLLNNYSDNLLVKDIDKSNQTALNIKVDEKYKGRPVGNVSAFGAYANRYKVSTSLFRFSKASNLSFIGNLNNTNEEVMSVLDYLNLVKSVKQYAKNSNALSDYSVPKIPDFISAKDNLSGNTTRFGALNFSYFPTERLKVEGFSILNYNKLTYNSVGNQRYPTGAGIFQYVEHKNNTNHGILNQTVVNVEYALSPQSLLHYSLSSNPASSDDFLDINRSESTSKSTINEQNNRQESALGQQLTYMRRLSEKSLLTATTFHEFGSRRQEKKLQASAILLGAGNDFLQKQHEKHIESGFYAKYTVKPDKLIYSFLTEYQHLSENFSAALHNGSSNKLESNEIHRARNVASAGVELAKKTGLFQFSFLNRGAYIPQFGKQWYYLPRVSLKLEPKNTRNITLTYGRDFAVPQLRESADMELLADYQNQFRRSIDRHQTLLRHQFSGHFLYTHLFSGTFLFGGISYEIAENPIVSYTEIAPEGYSKIVYRTAERNAETWQANISIERKIKPLRLRWKITSTAYGNRQEAFFAGQADVVKNRLFSPLVSLSSRFKNPVFDVSAGIKFVFNTTEYQYNNYRFQSEEYAPFLNFEGVIDAFSYKLQNRYRLTKNPYRQRDFFQLDALFSYGFKKGEIFVQASDLLNIESTETVISSVVNFVENTQILARIPGYIGLGITYKL